VILGRRVILGLRVIVGSRVRMVPLARLVLLARWVLSVLRVPLGWTVPRGRRVPRVLLALLGLLRRVTRLSVTSVPLLPLSGASSYLKRGCMFVRLVSALPLKYRPFAKALIPSVTVLAGDLVSAISTGAVNVSEVKAAGLAVLMAGATYLIPNFDPTGRLTPDQPA
jgi:hypothetical protein